jgi:hypothetical protein
MRRCLARTFECVTLPKPANGSETTVDYPLVFDPGE